PRDAGSANSTLAPGRVISKPLGIIMRHHRGAAPRWRDDQVRVGKSAQKLAGHLARVIPEAGIKCWLAAAGLGHWKTHLDAQMYQHFHHRYPGLWVKRVDHAGDEQGNRFVTWGWSQNVCHVCVL